MPSSKDPEKRAASLRNLKPDAAVKHRVYSGTKLAPLVERFAAELAERFGKVASEDEIALLAERRAKLEVLNVWLVGAGLLADRRSGRPRAVLALADRLQLSYERQFAVLRARAGGVDRDAGVPFEVNLAEDESLGLRSSDRRIAGLRRTAIWPG